jgi:hypothetical protein
MKLDRSEGKGKYALIRLRKIGTVPEPDVAAALGCLARRGLLDYGPPGSDSEFFVVRLKDRSAAPALLRYAVDADTYDKEYADDVRELARRATAHPGKKTPD